MTHLAPFPPAAGGNVPPVEPPGDDGHGHAHGLTGERHRGASRSLDRLLRRAGHRGRGCGEDNECSCQTNKQRLFYEGEFGDPVETHKALEGQRETTLGSGGVGKIRQKHSKLRTRRWTYCSRTHRSGRRSRPPRRIGSWPGYSFGRSGIRTARERIGPRAPWWLHRSNAEQRSVQGRATAGGTEAGKGNIRQSVSSELSSQSLSPSQRHSLRAQRPFLHLNSLGSQGEGVPVGETVTVTQLQPAGRARHFPPPPTASELVTSVRAVLLAIADVVPRDALAVLAGGLVHPAGPREDGLLDKGGGGGRGCEDWGRDYFCS